MLLELPVFEHINARSIEEAVAHLYQHEGDAKVIAGGTDLLSLMKDRVEGPHLKAPKFLVNIKGIPGINGISAEEGGLRIGAAVPLSRLASFPVIKERFRILSEAARSVGTTQIRNMGTVGGNLLQRPRCLYFRHPHFICHKKGGTACYAISGEHRDHHSILEHGRCTMAHPSDLAPALAALKARLVVSGPEGEKEIPLKDFFLGPNHLVETILNPSEILKEIRVPHLKTGSRQFFLKHRLRRSVDFALSSVSAIAHLSGGVCEEVSIVLGGIAPFPYPAIKAEEILKANRLDQNLITRAAEASVEGWRPLPMNRYKADLTKALVRRVLTSIVQDSGVE